MSGCVHKVKLSVRRPEKCKLNLSVSRYKDRIVAPDEYTGATTITPSDDTQTIPTKDKLVRADVTVLPAPTEPFSTTENGQFTPSEGNVGFSSFTVDVNPDLRPLSVSENGQYSPDGFDGYSNVNVNIPFAGTLVKTVTLTEDIIQYPNAWRQYLELDKGVYIVVFEGNTYATASRRANMLILGQGINDTNSAGITVRNDWKNAVAGASVDCGASAGTVVKVYQMPTGINAS